MPSFMVSCPSCEADVLIKDKKLVGTKTECPKCKYRFKVEEPTGDATENDPKANKSKKTTTSLEVPDAAKKKKKKKLIAIGVGVVAVAVLAIVGVTLMSGDNKGAPAKTGTGPIAKGPGPGPIGPTSTNPKDLKDSKDSKDPKETGKKDPAVETVVSSIPKSGKESTNLLPGETVSLFRFDLDKLRQTTVNPLFDGQMVTMFRDSFGFDAENVGVYYHAFVGNTRDPFGVMQLKTPVNEKEILANMSLANETKKVHGHTLHAFKSNAFINAIANTCSFSSLFGDLFAKAPPAPIPTPNSRIIGICCYDSQHLLVGDFGLLDRYLNELENTGYPKPQSAVKPPPGSSLTQAKRPLYLSINPQLKIMLENLDAETTSPPPLLYAEKYTQGLYDPKFFKHQYHALAAMLDPILNRVVYLGGNILHFSAKELNGTIKLRLTSGSEALEIAKSQITPGLTIGTEMATAFLGSPVEFINKIPGAQPAIPQVGPGMNPGMGPGSPGSPGSPSMPGKSPGLNPSSYNPQGGGTMRPPGQPGSGPGPGPGNMRPPGQPGSPSKPGSPSYPGAPGGPGQPVTPTPPKQQAQSKIELSIADQEITITVDMHWNNESYNKVSPFLFTYISTLKGKIAVYASTEPFHGLSAAVPKMIAQTRELAFPRGTFDRQVSDVTRRGLKYPPNTRVSFFAEILPYIGRGNLRAQIDTEKPWFDPANLSAAQAWVPEFLVPTYPQPAWRATSPFVPGGETLGATNYVAIAGIGSDAARLDPNNPADAKKVGLVGYDWGSKVSDVKDGLSNTIYMMETPPGLSQPWIQGGGATLRGFDETDPMQGFRHMNPNGQVGTYAMMGDGSVRFIKGNIDPRALLGMATRAGGENLADVLDTEAPLLNPPKKPEPKPEPPPAPLKKEAPASPKEPAPALPKLEAAPPPRAKA